MEVIYNTNPCIFVLVVTGSSEGIGKAYAFAVSDCLNSTACVCMYDKHVLYSSCRLKYLLFIISLTVHCCFPQLAEQGMNVVIMSRTKANLDQVAKKIGESSVFTFFFYCVCFYIFYKYGVCHL